MFHEKGFRDPGSGFNKMTDIQIQSTITCPQCNGKTIEQMPTDYCQYFWECPHCKNNLKPKKNDCCVYCSYGTNPCPSKQI